MTSTFTAIVGGETYGTERMSDSLGQENLVSNSL